MTAEPATNAVHTRFARRLHWLAGPAVLLTICCGFYWRLILTDEYTWLDSPDLIHQETPRFQFQAARWHEGAFPLWDPHQWCGQPFLGQIVGAANPLNWPFFLLPLDDSGKVPISVLHWYFVAIHFVGGLFTYWLCRDLRLSRLAAIAGGCVFAFNGFFFTNSWVGIMGGFVWAPLVFMFLLRVLRNYRPIPSSALCGLCLGAAWLSGHHEIPIYLSFAVAGVWLYHLITSPINERWRILRMAALALAIAALTSGFQTLPGYEYARLAKRWVGAEQALSWGEKVPYVVDTTYSFRPGSVPGLIVPWLVTDANGFLGLAALTLALMGVIACWNERSVRVFTAVALFGLLFAMGTYNIFHGVLYAVAPLFGKARVPGRLLSMFDFGAAPLAAYGLDALLARRALPAIRRIGLALLAAGGGLYLILLGAGALNKYEPNEHIFFTAFIALLLGGLLIAWHRGSIPAGPAACAVCGLMLIELGMMSGYFVPRAGNGGGAYFAQLTAYDDIANFLRKRRGPIRVDFADQFNFGDWEGIECLQGFGASITANILQLDWAGPRTQDLLGVAYSITRAPARPGQMPVFEGASGFHVYQNPTVFPRVWSVHRTAKMNTAANIRADIADPGFNLRAVAPMLDSPPALETCDGADEASLTWHSAGSVAIDARMACRGMVILSDTWYPGWHATVDGRPVDIYQPYAALRGVVVPQGEHKIVMHYRPGSALLGGILTVTGILGACVVAVAGHRVRNT